MTFTDAQDFSLIYRTVKTSTVSTFILIIALMIFLSRLRRNEY